MTEWEKHAQEANKKYAEDSKAYQEKQRAKAEAERTKNEKAAREEVDATTKGAGKYITSDEDYRPKSREEAIAQQKLIDKAMQHPEDVNMHDKVELEGLEGAKYRENRNKIMDAQKADGTYKGMSRLVDWNGDNYLSPVEQFVSDRIIGQDARAKLSGVEVTPASRGLNIGLDVLGALNAAKNIGKGFEKGVGKVIQGGDKSGMSAIKEMKALKNSPMKPLAQQATYAAKEAAKKGVEEAAKQAAGLVPLFIRGAGSGASALAADEMPGDNFAPLQKSAPVNVTPTGEEILVPEADRTDGPTVPQEPIAEWLAPTNTPQLDMTPMGKMNDILDQASQSFDKVTDSDVENIEDKPGKPEEVKDNMEETPQDVSDSGVPSQNLPQEPGYDNDAVKDQAKKDYEAARNGGKIGLSEDPNKTNYVNDEWNQGMVENSNDVVSDERCKKFLTTVMKHEPNIRSGAKKITLIIRGK